MNKAPRRSLLFHWMTYCLINPTYVLSVRQILLQISLANKCLTIVSAKHIIFVTIFESLQIIVLCCFESTTVFHWIVHHFKVCIRNPLSKDLVDLCRNAAPSWKKYGGSSGHDDERYRGFDDVTSTPGWSHLVQDDVHDVFGVGAAPGQVTHVTPFQFVHHTKNTKIKTEYLTTYLCLNERHPTWFFSYHYFTYSQFSPPQYIHMHKS